LGQSHTIDTVFTNRQTVSAPSGAVSSFDWEADENGVKISSSSDTGNTKLFFGSDGKIVTGTGASATQTVDLAPTNGASKMTMSLDFSAVSSLATETEVQATSQDGFPPGSLSSFNIEASGAITGVFTNGLTRTLGQVALALFPNAAGLERTGSNLLRETDNSGLPVIGTPGTNGRGSLNAGFLEQSNVDISTEFTDLIVTQRGFQANTKVVTTVDEMLQDLISMKR
jgi:flagellar hook protein FlgE